MLEEFVGRRWLAALAVAGSAGCGKVARDDVVWAAAASAGMNAAVEAGSGGHSAGSGGLSGAAGGTESGGSPSLPSGGETGCGPLIDDLENGSGHICTGSGRLGVWYAFNDKSGEQWPEPTAPGIPIATSLIPGGRGASTRAIHTYGKGFGGWGAGVGLDFAFDGVSYGTYDASAFDGIRFWARSEIPQKLTVRVGTRATKIAEYGGTCLREPCSPHAREFDVGVNWVELSLPFNDIPQLAARSTNADFLRDELTHLQFMPPHLQPFDFWIDDVRFYRDRSCCSQPPTGCSGAIVFPDVGIEERVRRSAGKPQGVLRCEDVCNVSPLLKSGLTNPPQIADLAGLQCLVGLTQLSLASNQVVNVSPLTSLSQLTSLDLSNNLIRNAAPLSGLHALQSLDLQRNQLESLIGLGDLPSLTLLRLDDNLLSDVSAAANFSALTTLIVNRNQLVSVRALTALPSLRSLSVESNPLQDLTQFLEFPNLTSVDLAGSPQSCTPEEAAVVQALLARHVGVESGSIDKACALP